MQDADSKALTHYPDHHMILKNHIFEFKLHFDTILVCKSGFQFTIVIGTESLKLYLLGKIDSVERHSFVDSPFAHQ